MRLDQTCAGRSGFVLDTGGHLITNHYVVENATSVMLQLADGTTIRAEVVGSDESSDFAVLRADPTMLTPVAISGSSDLRIGQQVLAIGSPLGLAGSVTAGIVSATDRDALSGGVGLIQTDASINPGNCG